MEMRLVSVNGLLISFGQVLKGQVGMQCLPRKLDHWEVWEMLHRALSDSGKLICSDQIGEMLIFVTAFSSVEEALDFCEAENLVAEEVLHDELQLIALK